MNPSVCSRTASILTVTFAAAVAVIVVGGGCSRAHQADEDEEPAHTTRLVETSVVAVKDRDDVVTAWGSITPDAQAARAVTSALEGTVLRVLVRAGTSVKRGAVLAEIRTSAQGHLDAEKARIDVGFAEAELVRRQALLEKKLVTNADVAAEEAELAKAKAELAAFQAGARGGVVAVVAPDAGVVSAVVVNAGDAIAVGGSVAVLVSGQALRAHLGIEPTRLYRLLEGQRVRLSSLDGTVTGSGKLVQLSRQVDADTHLAAALVEVDAGVLFLPGTLVRAEIVIGTLAAALVVPRKAVTRRADHDIVFVVVDNVAHGKAVDVLASDDDTAAVAAGSIAAGDVVVVAGSASLVDGATVRTVDLPDARDDATDQPNDDANDDAKDDKVEAAPADEKAHR